MTVVRRVVLTRTREQSLSWQTELVKTGVDVLLLPMIRQVSLGLPEKGRTITADWILFTSPQGVRAFCEIGMRQGDARVGTLGEGTAAMLSRFGLSDDLGVRAMNGAALAQAFCERVAPPATVLLSGAVDRLAEPAATLSRAGFAVESLPLYRTEAVPAAELPTDPFQSGDMIFFASPSAVVAFADAYDARPSCTVIGTTTAQAAREHGFTPLVADAPSLAGLCRAADLTPPPEPER